MIQRDFISTAIQLSKQGLLTSRPKQSFGQVKEGRLYPHQGEGGIEARARDQGEDRRHKQEEKRGPEGDERAAGFPSSLSGSTSLACTPSSSGAQSIVVEPVASNPATPPPSTKVPPVETDPVTVPYLALPLNLLCLGCHHTLLPPSCATTWCHHRSL